MSDTPTEKPAKPVKDTYYALYGEIMDVTKSQITAIKKDINRGKRKDRKEVINRYGAYIETKHKETMERIKRHTHEINKLKAKHTAELYKQQRSLHDKQVEKERFFIDFIRGLDPKTKRQAQSDYHERFGTFM